jgi:hypothetical protein
MSNRISMQQKISQVLQHEVHQGFDDLAEFMDDDGRNFVNETFNVGLNWPVTPIPDLSLQNGLSGSRSELVMTSTPKRKAEVNLFC